MSNKNETALCLTVLGEHFSKACYALARATRDESGEEALVVMIRLLQENPVATIEELASALITELGEIADGDILSLVHCLHRLLGPEWYVAALHFYLLDVNDGCRDDTREECPLYGDDVEEVRDYWQRTFDQFDANRAQEEEAARAWFDRRARKAA
jgi:hypothetical protein